MPGGDCFRILQIYPASLLAAESLHFASALTQTLPRTTAPTYCPRMDAKAIREKLLDHISPWVTGGMLLALTGAAPEDWVSQCAHIVGASNSYGYIRSVGIDLRVFPVAVGVLVIVVHTLLHQRRRTAARFANQTAPNALPLAGC